MKVRMLPSIWLAVVLLPSSGFSSSYPAATGETICGEYIRKTWTSGFEFEFYLFATPDETLGISSQPPFEEGFYRIYDPVIVLEPTTFADGTHVERFITSWSSYELISGTQDCAQATTQDLEVTRLDVPPQPICLGSSGDVSAFIQNNGSVESGSFYLRWNIDGQIFDGLHDTIPPGVTDTHGHFWENIPEGPHSITFIVDPDDLIPEADENNNQYTITFTAINCSSTTAVTSAPPTEPPVQIEPPTEPPAQTPICGWVENDSQTGALAPVLTVWETKEVIDLAILDSFRLEELIDAGIPGYFQINDPVIDNGSLLNYSQAVKVDSCESSLPATEPPLQSSADVKVTNFTLANTLTDFSIMQQPTVYRPNALWIEVTNKGQTSFDPPGGTGLYTLQVILKKPGSKLEEYHFVPGKPLSLEPLRHLGAGESRNLLITNLFFFTAVDNAELEVFLAPKANLGLQNSILSKSISVQKHPENPLSCAKEIAEEVANSVLPEKGAVAAIKALIDVLSALSALADPPPCLILSDLINAYLHRAIQGKYPVNGVMTESPVYPLVTNPAGQQAGFLENGQIVDEIPDAQVLTLGEKRIVLYPGQDVWEVNVFGYANGTMNLNATFAQGPSTGITVSYSNVQVTQGMVATTTSSDSQYILEVDTNGDNVTDRSIAPNEILLINESGTNPQPVASPSTTSPTSPPILPSSGLSVVLIALILTIGAMGIYAYTHVNRRQQAMEEAVSASDTAHLIGSNGIRAGQVVVLVDGMLIGRDSHCNLRLPDRAVSRQHARIRYAQDQWFIQDMGSKTGTYVNDVRVNATALNTGDRVRVGSAEFVFRT